MNVLITGAANGIGEATKEYYLNNNHNVIALDIKEIKEQENLKSFIVDINYEDSCSWLTYKVLE